MTQPNRDRGASTIAIVLAMPVLILAASFVFDGGRGIVARRETQSAADAGALAKATDCARSISTTVFTAYATNGTSLANSPTCGSGTTTVQMSKTIDWSFVPGGGSRTVTRSATARWGTLGSTTVAPIILSSCEFSTAILDGTTDVFFYLDDTTPLTGCSSPRGGFSKLDDDDCQVVVAAGSVQTADGQPGVALQRIIPCLLNSSGGLPSEILIALYDASACNSACQGRGPYTIAGFAMLRLTGYSFNGNFFAGAGMPRNCPDRSRGRYCIRGDFVRYTTSTGTPGSSTNFGLLQVALAS